MMQELKFNLQLNIRHINHRAIDGRVCFHRWPFANPVKPRWSTTGSVQQLRSTNKVSWDVKLLSSAISACHVNCGCFCAILKAQHYCMCSNGWYNPPTAAHPPPLPSPPITLLIPYLPAHPLAIYQICDIAGVENSKSSSVSYVGG